MASVFEPRQIVSRGCSDCALFPPCGGLEIHTADLFGCYDRCRTKCLAKECDLTCSNNQPLFWERWAEVGGLLEFSHSPFTSFAGTNLRPYMPMIRSGVLRRRRLNSEFVALSLYEALRMLRTPNGYKALSRSEFRKKLRLRDDCKILLVGVSYDAHIESFWRRHAALIPLLPALDVVAVTAPNFSSFTDVPREHILYNRKRALRIADKFLLHGIAVIPHFNAINWRDWKFWSQLLRETPHLRVFCKEFQTGNRTKINCEETIDDMVKLQDDVGEALHPIVVAGGRSVDLLRRKFATFTVIDSNPSMKTNMRQIAELAGNGMIRWRKILSKPNKCLSSLLDHNVSIYTKYMLRMIQGQMCIRAKPSLVQTPAQPLLNLL